MIENINDINLYKQADQFTNLFRQAVREAQAHAHRLGIAYTFEVNGVTYVAQPNGDIAKQADGGERSR